MKKNRKIIIFGIAAALMLSACGDRQTGDVEKLPQEEQELSEENFEETTAQKAEEESALKVNENNDNTDNSNAGTEAEEEQELVLVNVNSSKDALNNLLVEGTDYNEYSSAKDYIEKTSARGMGDTLADTLAVFNRCGFEYYGCDIYDLESDIYSKDDFSSKVIVTADGDMLFYLITNYSSDYGKSGYENYKLWKINDQKQYDILADYVSVGYKMFGDYYYVDNKFPLSPDELEDLEFSLELASPFELRLMKNSVYASKGRKFTSPELAAIYGAQNWYQGTIDAKDFDNNIEKYLSKDEQKYIDVIVKYEQKIKNSKNESEGTLTDNKYELCKCLINGSYIDVNGDNKKDRILWGWHGLSELNVYVQLADGPEIELEHYGESVYYYVCYIDSEYLGNCLMTSEYGSSDDALTYVYAIKGNECVQYGDLNVYPSEILFYDDHIVAGFRGYHINTEEIRTDYILDKNGEFAEHNDGYYEYRGNTVKALVDIKTFADKNSNVPGITIKKNNDFVILGGDLDTWIKVRDVKSGTECWLMTQYGNVVFPDGTQMFTYEAMDGIIIYD